MPEGQAAETPTKRKGLLAFYVATGLLALLFVAFYFVWTPLRVWYWEREVMRRDYSTLTFYPLDEKGRSYGTPCTQAARNLVDMGPAAEPALRRLFRNTDFSRKMAVLVAFDNPDCKWALPLLVEEVRANEELIAGQAILAVERVTGMRFSPSFVTFTGTVSPSPTGERSLKIDNGSEKLLTWWKREGKAKYGSGVE